MVDKTVYLAGPIDGFSFQDGVEWRERARMELAVEGIKGISPQRGKKYVSEHKGLADNMDFSAEEELFRGNPMSTSRGVLSRDKFDALICDAFLVNFLGATGVAIGTVMEIAWAYLQG